MNLEDLVSAGTIGWIQAIDRFDPSRGLLVKTLADHRIRGAVFDYLRQLDPLPRSIRRFVKLREQAIARLTGQLGRVTEAAQLSQELSLSMQRIRKLERVASAGQVRRLEPADIRRLAG